VAKFTDADRIVLSVGEDGMIRRWDVETGKLLGEGTIHAGIITDMQVSPDGTHVLTASKDKSAKIIDPVTLEIIREYRHTRPVNSAAMSPLQHVRPDSSNLLVHHGVTGCRCRRAIRVSK
jgi:translation initiation factor 3 subunit I